MGEKEELIAKMQQMQKQFMEYEHEFGVDQLEYFSPPAGHPLENYKEEYTRLANRVVELAHEEKGSKR